VESLYLILIHISTAGLHEIKPDLNRAAEHFILAFRKGQFGRVALDQLESHTFDFEHSSYENSAYGRNYSDSDKNDAAPLDLSLPVGDEDDVNSSLLTKAQS